LYGRFGVGLYTVPDNTTIASAGSRGIGSWPYQISRGSGAIHADTFIESTNIPMIVMVSRTGFSPFLDLRQARTSPKMATARSNGSAGSKYDTGSILQLLWSSRIVRFKKSSACLILKCWKRFSLFLHHSSG